MKKRIAMLLTVVAMMMVMMAVTIAPAFADGRHLGLCIKVAQEQNPGLSTQEAAHLCQGKV
jgi:hypothetical protein